MQDQFHLKNIFIQKKKTIVRGYRDDTRISDVIRKWILLTAVIFCVICCCPSWHSNSFVECKVNGKLYKASYLSSVDRYTNETIMSLKGKSNRKASGVSNGTEKPSGIPKTRLEVEIALGKTSSDNNSTLKTGLDKTEAFLGQLETTMTLPKPSNATSKNNSTQKLTSTIPPPTTMPTEKQAIPKRDNKRVYSFKDVDANSIDIVETADDEADEDIVTERKTGEIADIEYRKDDLDNEDEQLEESEEDVELETDERNSGREDELYSKFNDQIDDDDANSERFIPVITFSAQLNHKTTKRPYKSKTTPSYSHDDTEEEDDDYDSNYIPSTTFPTLPKIKVTYPKKVATTKRPRPKPTLKSTKPPKHLKFKSTPRPASKRPYQNYDELDIEDRDPHHPHGIVVLDQRPKRKRRPPTTTPKPRPKKPVRQKPKLKPTRRITTTKPTTTTTSSPDYDEIDDYYDYYLTGSGEDSLNGNFSLANGSDLTIGKIPLSKLALAMLTSSNNFKNMTEKEKEDLLYYQKSPINLLHILQAYTKQLQVAQTETLKPPVKIATQPFLSQLSRLNFMAKLGMSFYYSVIALTPLLYLGLGGYGGRLGLGSLAGRTLGLTGLGKRKKRRRRRKKRSSGSFYDHDDEDYYYYGERGNGNKRNKRNGNSKNFSREQYQANAIRRIQLKDHDNDDEYSWILERISEVIWKLSQLSHDIENDQ